MQAGIVAGNQARDNVRKLPALDIIPFKLNHTWQQSSNKNQAAKKRVAWSYLDDVNWENDLTI